MVLVFVLLPLAALVSGCSVDPHASVALGLGADGSPVAYLQVCSKHIDGVTIYRGNTDLGKWAADRPATGFSTWSLATGGNGWTVTKPLAALNPGRSYVDQQQQCFRRRPGVHPGGAVCVEPR